MDTLWIQINLRSFINQMDASSWFMTPFWFKCRFFCNVVGLWRRYKYTEDISNMFWVCLCTHEPEESYYQYKNSLELLLQHCYCYGKYICQILNPNLGTLKDATRFLLQPFKYQIVDIWTSRNFHVKCNSIFELRSKK